jgi:preprotein translocase subunit SecG
MTYVFVILLVISCVVLGFIVLVQNPKGGGLAGNVGGLSNQFMGVKQTTDVLEKGTWLFAAIIGMLAVFSTLFLRGGATHDNSILDRAGKTAPAPAQPTPANTVPATPAPAKP